MAAAPAKPPEEVPAEIKEDVAKLQKPEDLADRWNTPAAARDNGPRDLGFQDGENGFNAQTSAFPLSPKPSRTSGATSSSGNGRSMSTSTGRHHAADPTTARSGRMGVCDAPPSKHVPQACPHLPK